MAITTCPNCGKQLRPGARFCGNCGATLPSGSSPGKGAGGTAAAQPPIADTLPCPNCGKPVRKGAKFCSQCGHTMEAALAAAGTAAGKAASDAPTLATAPARAGARTDAVPPAERRAAAPAPARPRSRLPLALLVVAAVICLAALGGGYFVASRQGWLAGVLPGGQNEPPATQAVSVVVTEAATDTALPPPTATVDEPPTSIASPEPTLPPTATEPPTAEPTLKPTLALVEPSLSPPLPTVGITATMVSLAPTITATVPISGAAAVRAPIFEDSFEGPLNTNWVGWGNPYPTIDSGPGYKWLSLKADDSGAGGVTTRSGVVIAFAPGLEIELTASVQERYPNSKLYLDWDPTPVRRGPELKDPGTFRLGLGKDGAAIFAPQTRESCSAPVDGLQQHRYILRVNAAYQLELYLDDDAAPACTLDAIGLSATAPGSISLTGRGWVTHIKIVQPVVEP